MVDLARAKNLERWLERKFPGQTHTKLGVTTLCIDGFPRSANSLLCRKVLATSAYTRPELAHNIHLRQNMECALMAGIPVILAARAPLDAISSYLVYNNGKNADDMFRRYKEILVFAVAHPHNVAIALFDETVENYAAVVDRVNRVHGGILPPPSADDETLNEMLAKEAHEESLHGSNVTRKIGVPSPDRLELKQEYRSFVESHNRFAECSVMYERILKVASRQ